MKWGVVVFPGSNDDRDTIHALSSVLGEQTEPLWHAQRDLRGVDAVVVDLAVPLAQGEQEMVHPIGVKGQFVPVAHGFDLLEEPLGAKF